MPPVRDVQPSIDMLREGFCQVANAWHGSRLLDCVVCYSLGYDWVDERWIGGGATSWRHHVEQFGLEAAWISDHVYGGVLPHVTTSIDDCMRLIHEVLPHHDGMDISTDPSGIGVKLANWRLTDPSENYQHEVGKGSHVTICLALLMAMYRSLSLKIFEEELTE